MGAHHARPAASRTTTGAGVAATLTAAAAVTITVPAAGIASAHEAPPTHELSHSPMSAEGPRSTEGSSCGTTDDLSDVGLDLPSFDGACSDDGDDYWNADDSSFDRYSGDHDRFPFGRSGESDGSSSAQASTTSSTSGTTARPAAQASSGSSSAQTAPASTARPANPIDVPPPPGQTRIIKLPTATQH